MAGATGRRAFLGRGVIAIVAAATRRLWMQAGGSLRYRPLERPVVVPLADVAESWRARSFVADARTLASAARPNQPIRIAGMMVRTDASANDAGRFSAVSVQCPHEHCNCDFVPDPGRLPPEVVQEIGRAVTEPVYLCPCHNSTFRAVDGERLAGPAPRGLYRFRVTAVGETAVEIAEVEEDVLIFG
jgi:Rieske Fe-S protein